MRDTRLGCGQLWIVCALAAFLVAGCCAPLRADTPASLVLSASPSIILADGKSTTTITALATGIGGGNVADGSVIRFSTTAGTLSTTSVVTTAGVARVILTSAGIEGPAVVTGSFLTAGVGASGRVSVEFTSDKTIANSDKGEQDWVHVACTDYMSYSEDSRILEAFAKNRGARFSYRGIVIEAEAMQVDLSGNVIRARNAVFRHNQTQLFVADSLRYEFISHQGTAIVTDMAGETTIRTVKISGAVPVATVLSINDAPSSSIYDFVDLSSDHVQVTASSVSVRPGQTVQLRRSTVYVDGKKVMSVPLEVLPVNSTEIFGQQVLGYGTDGAYINLPYYLAASSHTMDTLSLQSQSAQREAGIALNGNAAVALDYQHSYKFASDTGNGTIDLLGVQKGATMGYRWRNNMLVLDKDTRTYTAVEYPTRNNLFTTVNVTHDFRGFSTNVTNTYSHVVGDTTTTETRGTSYYVTTTERKLIGSNASGIRATSTFSVNTSEIVERYEDQTIKSPTDTRALGLRLFTPAQHLSRTTTFTDSFDAADTYDRYQDRSAVTMNSSLGLGQKFGKTTFGSLSYNWTHNPLNQALTINNGILSITKVPDIHRYGATLTSAAPSSKWDMMMSGDISKPTDDMDAATSFNYHFSPTFRIGVTNTVNRTTGIWYRDWGTLLGIRIGQREGDFSYSVIDHHIRFNLDASRF